MVRRGAGVHAGDQGGHPRGQDAPDLQPHAGRAEVRHADHEPGAAAGGARTSRSAPKTRSNAASDPTELEGMLDKVICARRSALEGRTRDASLRLEGSHARRGNPGRRDRRSNARKRRSTSCARSGSWSRRCKEKPKGIKFALPKSAAASSTKDLAIFTRQFATMISAGLPLVQCLDILAKQTDEAVVRASVIADVTREVEAGLDAGRRAGQAQEGVRRPVPQHGGGRRGGRYAGRHPDASRHLHREGRRAEAQDPGRHDLPGRRAHGGPGRDRVHAHLHHPDVRQDVHRTSAASCRCRRRSCSGLSHFLQHFWWAMAAGDRGRRRRALQRYYTTENGQQQIDGLMLKIPVLGDVLLKGAVARFTRTLGTLITSGVPILAGLEITARTAGNRVIADAIMTARASIREGETVAAPLKAVGRVPADGRADDLGRRADRRAGRDAHQDRGVLRGRGRPRRSTP